MDIPWVLHGYSMEISKRFHGYTMDIPLIFHGYTMDTRWIFHEYSMEIPWILHVCSVYNPLIFHGNNMGTRWSSHAKYKGMERCSSGNGGISFLYRLAPFDHHVLEVAHPHPNLRMQLISKHMLFAL